VGVVIAVAQGTGAKDKKAGSKPAGGKVALAGDDEDDRPPALQVELSVKLCLLSCDADAQPTVTTAVVDFDE